MVVVATGGNLTVIWIVLAHRRMRTVTNYFLVNLSIADTMVSIMNVVFNFFAMIRNDWPFGDYYCKFSNFVAILSVSASVFTLMAITVDRYLAIMFPLSHRMSKRCTIAVATVIWISSALLSLPNLLYSSTHSEVGPHGLVLRTVCYFTWPDGIGMESQIEYYYNIVLMIVTYFLPIILMTYAYTRVGIELWGSQSIGETTNKQVESIKSKRRVVKMLVVVVLMFALCWLPYHIYFIVISHYSQITKLPYIVHVYLAIYWLAMSNSMYNPIIYCWMNARFRSGFRKAFGWCFFLKESDNSHFDRLGNRSITFGHGCSYSGAGGPCAPGGSPDIRFHVHHHKNGLHHNGYAKKANSNTLHPNRNMANNANSLQMKSLNTENCSINNGTESQSVQSGCNDSRCNSFIVRKASYKKSNTVATTV